MSLEYIRLAYKVPARRGVKVEYLASDGELIAGTIVGSSDQYLRVRLDGNKHTSRMHPTWRLKYLPDGPCFDRDGVGEVHLSEMGPANRERDHLDPPRDD